MKPLTILLTLTSLLAGCGQTGRHTPAALTTISQATRTLPTGTSGGSTTAGGVTRTYEVYSPPTGTSKARPLVVMLHGCTQNPADFAAGTQMNALADVHNFVVLYPAQDSAANANKCWNWFEPAHQTRGLGEPAVIKAMVDQIRSVTAIDDRRVYVAGLSAGGAMSVIMAATYPDVFAASGVSAGLEYQAGTDLVSGVAAMSLGGPNPALQGTAAFRASGSQRQGVPSIIFHGTNDVTVAPVNGQQAAEQALQTADLADDGLDNDSISGAAAVTSEGAVAGGRSYTVTTYAGGQVELWKVNGMTHAWSGGNAAGSYTDSAGPDASAELWRFFSAHHR
ncbi:alpha/beta hydrolase family esterase [Deinococcus navajonensis]|uniref:Alpha/beta hydrolase family esterase n=1 Tax=Deinococcus navajonensis TaxID=309884 RepID=A0ABV8XJ39_9DEIO